MRFQVRTASRTTCFVRSTPASSKASAKSATSASSTSLGLTSRLEAKLKRRRRNERVVPILDLVGQGRESAADRVIESG